MTRDDYVKSIKDAFVTIGARAAEAALTSELPALMANPIAHYVISHLVKAILQEVADAAEMQAFFLYIDVRTSKQGQDFFEAAKLNLEAKKSGNAKEMADAEKNLIDKFRVFAKLSA